MTFVPSGQIPAIVMAVTESRSMQLDTVLALTIAICCLLALAAASGALEATVTTEPAEAIDSVIRGLVGAEAQTDWRDVSSRERVSEASPDATAGDGSDAEQERNLREMLLALFDRLLDLLVSLLPWMIVLVSLALAVFLRDRITRAFVRIRESPGSFGASQCRSTPHVYEPHNRVEAAWIDMAAQLGFDVDGNPSRTPREWAITAVDAGADPSAVEAVTRTFEEVRYGEAPVTDDRIHRVRRGLAEVDRNGRRR